MKGNEGTHPFLSHRGNPGLSFSVFGPGPYRPFPYPVLRKCPECHRLGYEVDSTVNGILRRLASCNDAWQPSGACRCKTGAKPLSAIVGYREQVSQRGSKRIWDCGGQATDLWKP